MTTQSWSTVVQHSSDATFRTWGAEYAAKLALIGMVQTADTGQINWATVTRPGTNTAGGYEIWRFNDSLAGSAPIYLKIEYGTAGNAAVPTIWVTVGTGSNGSGTITGTATARNQAGYASTSTYDSVSAWPSYFCHTEGFLGCVWKEGSHSSNNPASFAVCRYSDADGTPNGNGFVVYWGSTTSTTQPRTQSIRTQATAVAFTADTGGFFSLIVSGIGNTVTASGDIQVFAHWTITLEVSQLHALCTYVASEISTGSTFSVTMKGATAKTFIATGHNLGTGGVGSAGTHRIGMLWE